MENAGCKAAGYWMRGTNIQKTSIRKAGGGNVSDDVQKREQCEQ
jgi:hypothetical protein